MGTVTAFGNPLLDTTITITNNNLLRKYNLKADDQKEISRDEMRNLLQDIKTFEQKQSPGGCAQNTLRVMQWLLRKKCAMTIFGAVGTDNPAQILHDLLQDEGVQTRYCKNPEFPTGITVALVNGLNRSLVAHLGAAEVFTVDDLLNQPESLQAVENSDLIYIEGFFLSKREKVARFVLDYCKRHNKNLAFNISAQYVCEETPETVQYFCEHSNLVFGNKREFQALCPVMDYPDIDSLLKGLSKDGKIIVVTDGANAVTCVHSGGASSVVDAASIEAKEIVDTTGAGDAFVAGFLAGYLLKRTPVNCTELGCYAAQEIVKMSGCVLPKHAPNVLL